MHDKLIGSTPNATEPVCCNAGREMTLHEQLVNQASNLSRCASRDEARAEGFRTLADMLPVELNVRQQAAIRRVLSL